MVDDKDNIPYIMEWKELFPRLNDIYFANNQKGWAVGNTGTIIHTEDGGKNWQVQETKTVLDLSYLNFINDSIGWAIGDKGAILFTNNEGKTWARQNSKTNNTLYSASFIDNNHGWIGGFNCLLKTVDGGANWEYKYFDQSFWEIKFIDEHVGWATGPFGVLLKSLDGGNTWNEVLIDDLTVINGNPKPYSSKLHFIKCDSSQITLLYQKEYKNKNNSYESSFESFIATSINNGIDWSIKPIPYDNPIDGSIYINDRTIWYYNQDTTSNAIEEFNLETSDTNSLVMPSEVKEIKSVHFIDNANGWAISDNNIIKTDDGGRTWTTQRQSISGYPDAINIINEQEKVIIHSGIREGVFLNYTNDGGKTWKRKSITQDDFRISYAKFFQNGYGIMLLTNGFFYSIDTSIIMVSNNGGKDWVEQNSNVGNLSIIHFLTYKDGLGISYNEKSGKTSVLKTNNSGKDWDINFQIEDYINNIYFLNSRKGWLVGYEKKNQLTVVYETDNGGENWNRREFENISSINAIMFKDEDYGWMVGRCGIIYETNNGGKTWQTRFIGRETTLNKVFFFDNINGIIAADDYIFTTSDGINYNIPPTHRYNDKLQDVFQRGNDIFLVGLGFIYKNEKKHYLPKIIGYNIGDGIASLKIVVDDKNVAISKLEFSKNQRDWIEPTYKITKTDSVSLISWNPSDYLAPGSDIYFRTTLKFNNYSYIQELPNSFTYLTFWERLNPLSKGILIFLLIIAAYFVFLFVVLHFSPITILTIYKKISLKDFAGTLSLSNPLSFILKLVIDSTFLPYFVCHPRVLDAWVSKHRERTYQAFTTIPSVSQRKNPIPLPLRIKYGSVDELLPEPSVSKLKEIFGNNERTVVSINGVGGSGKSTLAFYLASLFSTEINNDRAFDFPVIPILIDAETEDILTSIKNKFKQIFADFNLPDEVLISLLKNKRILVIVDALSEKSSMFYNYIQNVHCQYPINFLIITSRTDIDFNLVNYIILNPQNIDEKNFLLFFTEYINRLKLEENFEGEQLIHLSNKLFQIIKRKSNKVVITPLIIKIFVDNSAKLISQNSSLEEVPITISETIVEYLRQLNPQQNNDYRISHDKMLNALKILGVLSLEPNMVPQRFTLDDATTKLRESEINDFDVVLERLVRNNILIKKEVAAISIFEFNLDPIAEYLAALHYIEENESDERKWDLFITTFKSQDNYPYGMQGFLVALEDSIITYREIFAIPLKINLYQ